jgi:hypothetical protein
VAALKKKNSSVLFGRRSLPSVPAFAPGWDAFYLAIFAGFKRCLAPHDALECACRWSCGRQGKPSKLSHLPGDCSCLHAHVEQVYSGSKRRACGARAATKIEGRGMPGFLSLLQASLPQAVQHFRRIRLQRGILVLLLVVVLGDPIEVVLRGERRFLKCFEN